jgi:hypothetical protein
MFLHIRWAGYVWDSNNIEIGDTEENSGIGSSCKVEDALLFLTAG